MAKLTVHSRGRRVAAVLRLQSAAPYSEVGLVQSSAGEDGVCLQTSDAISTFWGALRLLLSPVPHFSLHRHISE